MEKKLSTSVMSFSIDLNSLNYLDSYATLHRTTMSAAVRYHIKMGRIYLKMLDEQLPADGAEDVEE